jgi:hypothetical protein
MGMKTTWTWLVAALAVLALVAAGCGSDSGDSTSADEAPATLEEIEVDTGPFGSDEEFVSAIDDACRQYGAFYARAPVYGMTADGLAAEFSRRVEINTAYQSAMESIEPTDGLADTYQQYLDAGAQLNANEEKVLAAAEDGDAEEANRILNEDNAKPIEDYDAAIDELGACASPEPDQEKAAAPADGAEGAPQPDNTIEDAAAEYLDAFKSGDCQRIADVQHSQNYAEVLDDCSDIAAGSKDSEILATAQYGPVGAAMVGTPESAGYAMFELDPKTGGLQYTGTVYTDANGLEPPNDGIDADETIQATIDAIRNDDVAAFNDALTIDTEGPGTFEQKGDTIKSLGSDPVYADRVVADIKSDTEAEPELLGVDQTQAYYLLDTDKTDYILIARHEPGSETDYAFVAYWAITK